MGRARVRSDFRTVQAPGLWNRWQPPAAMQGRNCCSTVRSAKSGTRTACSLWKRPEAPYRPRALSSQQGAPHGPLAGQRMGGCAWPANGAIRSSPYARCWHLCCSPSPGLCTASQASPACRRIRGRAHFPLPTPVHPQRAQRPRHPSGILLLAAGRSAAYRLSVRPSRLGAYAPTRARQEYGFGAVQKGAPHPPGRTAHTGIAGFKKSRSACQKRQGIPCASNT